MLNSLKGDSKRFAIENTKKYQWRRLLTQRKIGKVASIASRTAEFCLKGDQ